MNYQKNEHFFILGLLLIFLGGLLIGASSGSFIFIGFGLMLVGLGIYSISYAIPDGFFEQVVVEGEKK